MTASDAAGGSVTTRCLIADDQAMVMIILELTATSWDGYRNMKRLIQI